MPVVSLHLRGAVLASAVALIAGISAVASLRPLPAQSQPQGFAFALIGDMAYYEEHEPWLANVHAEISREPSLAFVAHVGDLSRPVRSCREEVLKLRLSQFNAFPQPVIFTPGDNDWTDCHEKQGVKEGGSLTALDRLRTMFFAGEESLGKRKMRVTRQSQSPQYAKFRENVRFDIGGVTFVTLHVTGSNNNLGRTPEDDAEYGERNAANLVWLQQAFSHAKANNSRAVMIIQQANIFEGFPPLAGPIAKPSGFTDTLVLVETETIAFQKPVVLVHGDSHFFRMDNPFWRRPPRGQMGTPALENFRRVETFGSPDHHWVHVTVDPNDPMVFTFRPRIVAANVVKR
jgi:hypothetical protein